MAERGAEEDKTLTSAIEVLKSRYREATRRQLQRAEKLARQHRWLHLHQAIRYLELLGLHDTERLLATGEDELMKTIRTNTLKTDARALRRRLESKGFQLAPHPYIDYGLVVRKAPFSPGATLEYLLGYYTIQGPASMMAVPALEPDNASLIIDMCAGAGIKTTQMSQHNPHAPIIAFDINRRKLAALKNNSSRLGAANIIAYNLDARKATNMLGEGVAERVLLDAPCSGEGLIPYRKGRWPRSFNDIIDRMRLQYQLAATAARLLKKDAVLVYATCTISVEENEYLLTLLLQRHPELEPENPPIKGGIEGITEYMGLNIDPRLRYGCRRFFPHIHRTEGFTICRLRKT